MNLSRLTRDLDFTFEIIGDETTYETCCEKLIKLNYKNDFLH